MRNATIRIAAELCGSRLLRSRTRASFGRMMPTESGDPAVAPDLHSEHILAIAASRDRGSFTAIFSHFAPRVKAYLVRGGTPPALAEELTQEALLSVWRKAEQFDPKRASASTWIFTIARNLRIDAARRARNPTSLVPAMDTPDPPEEPFAIVAREQSQAVMRSALERLGVEQREVIRLSFFDSRSHSEIAEQLGIPLGTVKSRVRLAISKLRELVEGTL
jgi:RNA polymerase sigma-70 factor, ECF subfamily